MAAVKSFDESLKWVADYFHLFEWGRSSAHIMLAQAKLMDATIFDLLADLPTGQEYVPAVAPLEAVEAAMRVADWENNAPFDVGNGDYGLPSDRLDDFAQSVVVLRGLLTAERFTVPETEFEVSVLHNDDDSDLREARDCVVRGTMRWTDERGLFLSVENFRVVDGDDFPLPTWDGLSLALSACRSDFVSACVSVVRLRLNVEWEPEVGSLSWVLGALLLVHRPLSASDVEDADTGNIRAAVEIALEALEKTVEEMAQPFLPEPRLIKGADAAEDYAVEVLDSLGFSRARRTAKGADGGVDVLADGIVGQVKFEALPTGRPPVQALFGVAAVEDARGVFFSLAGYSPQAVTWADRAGIALLEFEADGSISAANEAGQDLLTNGRRFLDD